MTEDAMIEGRDRTERKVFVSPAKCGHHFDDQCASCQNSYAWTRTEMHDQQAEIERYAEGQAAYELELLGKEDQIDTLRTRAEQAEAEVGRLKADWGRLIHKDEAAAVCRSGVECCFEYGDTVRCGPCGIDLAKLAGVEPDMTKPQLPEVSRLKRQLAAMQAAIEQAAEEMEINGLDLDTLAPFIKGDADV